MVDFCVATASTTALSRGDVTWTGFGCVGIFCTFLELNTTTAECALKINIKVALYFMHRHLRSLTSTREQ